MERHSRKYILIVIFIVFLIGPVVAGAPDVTDAATERFLNFPFQYDFSKIEGDEGLYNFVMAFDSQLAFIEYRRKKANFERGHTFGFDEDYSEELDEKYLNLLNDGFIFNRIEKWRKDTSDPVLLSFFNLVLRQHREVTADPIPANEAIDFAQRLSNHLYSFLFNVNGRFLNVSQVVQLMDSTSDYQLARRLYQLQNDSAATLVPMATQLYQMYNFLGQQRGAASSFDYALVPLGYDREYWHDIAEAILDGTADEYEKCVESLKQKLGRDDLNRFEIEKELSINQYLPNNYFPPDLCDSVVLEIAGAIGLDSIWHIVRQFRADQVPSPAMALRLYPPFDDVLLRGHYGGYGYYMRLAGETGRLIPWVFADTTLPVLLRDYPAGTGEMLSGLFIDIALDSTLLEQRFNIPPETISKYLTYRKWYRIFQLRHTALYFLFDYEISKKGSDKIDEYFGKLEKNIFKISESSHRWIEILISGNLSNYPGWLAEHYSRMNLERILIDKFGPDCAHNKETGKFIIDSFARPGNSECLLDYFSAQEKSRLNAAAVKKLIER